MDTPERAQIGSPIPKFEESPFSNFINSLSPIKPAKAIHISQTFGSLSFTSPPSVFTSPQVSLQKETRFIRRYQLSELAKSEFSSGNENKQLTSKDGGSAAAEMPSDSTDAVKEAEPSEIEGSEREPKYNRHSPDFQTAPSFGYDAQSGAGTSSCIPLFKGESSKDSSGAQLGSFETGKNTDGSSGWDILVSDAGDLLAFESPQNPAVQRDSTEQPANEQTDLFASLFSDANNLDQQHGLDPSSDTLFPNEDQVTQPEQSENLGQICQGHDNDGTSCLSRSFSGQITGNSENKSVLHRGVRRRCLVFEIPGARKNVDGGIFSTSQSSQDEGNNSQQTLLQRGNSPLGMRPGFGLHLNALAVGSRGAENPSSENQLIPVPRSSDVFPSAAMGSESFKSSASISSEDLSNVDNEGQAIEDGSQASVYGAGEDPNPSSPKKKRRRPENTGEGEACKRCNCKKSKCLKLYCECFAAGVYCIEPCACQDCFNKPIHEDTVLATRKQIESRNPLAFAPKVIRGADTVNDIGQDDSNRTPASARHKRGCNCKKSNCLKKYCECYQGGVGCSIGCRCEGCKNTFGRKDGSSVGMELEVEEAAPAHENDIGERSLVQPGTQLDEELNPGSTLPKTPLGLFRSTMALPSSSKGKPPRFMGISSCSLLNRDGPGRSTFLRAQHKTDNKHPENATSVDELPPVLHNTSPSSSIKTLSPNSKRISPPHRDALRKSPGLRSSRKLILQSIPSFPSLTPRR